MKFSTPKYSTDWVAFFVLYYECTDLFLILVHDAFLLSCQMVGLYKDPNGESIKIFQTSAQREEAETNKTNKKDGTELEKLRRRVFELENSLSHKQVCYIL